MTAQIVSPDLDFTRQVRAERLAILWKVTLAGVFLMFWLALILSQLQQSSIQEIFLPLVAVGLGCVMTAAMLARNRYESAVWAFTFGILVAVAIVTLPSASPASGAIRRDLILFILPILVLLVGMLLPTRATVLVLALAIAITVFAPSLGSTFKVESHQFFAIFLIFLSAGLAIQTSGEIYGIAEWALTSYNKERAMKEQLFDSQEELKRSYMRQKTLADQLRETNSELEVARAQALEAKNFRGQFLANMSHELRTPLNAIIGFSETMLNFPMMYNNQTLPEAYRADLNQIFVSGKHLLQLINDILDLSKVDAGKLDIEIEPVDLDPVFKGVLSTAVGLVGEKPVKLRRDTPSYVAPVMGDPLRIRQVILNLMSNAAKFTDSGEITLGARDNGDGHMLLWIKDTGIGIAPQDVGRIFEEFRQGSAGRQKGRAGSGLGLAISRQLLNLMKGKIWVESEVGKGSTFFFTLPIHQPERVEAQQG